LQKYRHHRPSRRGLAVLGKVERFEKRPGDEQGFLLWKPHEGWLPMA